MGDGRFLSWYRNREADPAVSGMYIRDRAEGRTIGPFVSRPSEDWIFTRMGRTQPYVSYISSVGSFGRPPPEAYLFAPTTQAFIRIAPGTNVAYISAVGGNAFAIASSK